MERGKVTFTNQYWCFCSYAPILSKGFVVTNLWPQARRSELTLKKATFLYAIVMQTPFYLCKHILHTMLEVHDEKNTSLSFGCLITQIYLQVMTNISGL